MAADKTLLNFSKDFLSLVDEYVKSPEKNSKLLYQITSKLSSIKNIFAIFPPKEQKNIEKILDEVDEDIECLINLEDLKDPFGIGKYHERNARKRLVENLGKLSYYVGRFVNSQELYSITTEKLDKTLNDLVESFTFQDQYKGLEEAINKGKLAVYEGKIKDVLEKLEILNAMTYDYGINEGINKDLAEIMDYLEKTDLERSLDEIERKSLIRVFTAVELKVKTLQTLSEYRARKSGF